MKKFILIWKILVIIALFLPVMLSAKKPSSPSVSTINFSGLVMDKLTQEQLGGVYLYFEELQKGIYSEPDGSFNLEGVKPGTYKVTLKYISYHEKQLLVKVKKSGKTYRTILLEPVLP